MRQEYSRLSQRSILELESILRYTLVFGPQRDNYGSRGHIRLRHIICNAHCMSVARCRSHRMHRILAALQ